MTLRASVTWQRGLQLVGRSGSGHSVMIDAEQGEGPHGLGPTPKELTLVSLGGCAGSLLAVLLEHEHVPFRGLTVGLEADSASEHPQVFTEIRMVYRIDGEGIDRSRVDRVIQVLHERYCPVSAMLGKAVPIVFRCEVGGEGQASRATDGGER